MIKTKQDFTIKANTTLKPIGKLGYAADLLDEDGNRVDQVVFRKDDMTGYPERFEIREEEDG